jgi:hypothetical protein
MPYLNEIIKLKPFNPYFEISNLLSFIKNNTDGELFIFNDCPEGIALNTLDILYKEINIKPGINLFNKYITKHSKHSIDYNFVLNTIMQRNLFANNTRFNIDNEKIEQTMEVISLSMNLLINNNKELNNIANDIDPYQQIIINVENDGLFAVLRFGENSLYIAVFNLSNSPKRFYWDFSSHAKQNISDGVAVDIYTNSSYLVSNGKIHIRKIPSMDCCLIVKPLSTTLVNEA